MRQPTVIAPSILSANFARLGDDVARVVEAFKPKRFQTIQFIDDDSHLGLAMAADASLLAPAVMFGYTITNVSVNQYGPGYVIQMVHYVGDG